MILRFAKKYKWYLLGLLFVYVAVSMWLLFLTDSPQSVPFIYQAN